MEDLRISLVQADLVWQDKKANLKKFSELIDGMKEETDVIILPEMFSTGFSMNSTELAEAMWGPTMQWMSMTASSRNISVAGSLIIKEDSSIYNRFLWIKADGSCQYYDKRHLFAMAGEADHYSAGHSRIIVEEKQWRILPLICYDLRFPVWSRYKGDYDLMVYVANWPDRRSHDWKLLLQARAIENQCYVAGVNRIGTDHSGYHYTGDSMVIDPGWNRILYHNHKREEVFTIRLSHAHLTKVRGDLPFLKERDSFELTNLK